MSENKIGSEKMYTERKRGGGHSRDSAQWQ